ncbi:hypothetical protein [Streptomyces cremeus]|uniref:hypothetical protein n=1 Tax=Streptomyces cremeus TaxID=66881 RepID=UPI0031EA6B8D
MAAAPGREHPAQVAVDGTVGGDVLRGEHGEHLARRVQGLEDPGGAAVEGGDGAVPAHRAPVAAHGVGDQAVAPQGEDVAGHRAHGQGPVTRSGVRPAGASGGRVVRLDPGVPDAYGGVGGGREARGGDEPVAVGGGAGPVGGGEQGHGQEGGEDGEQQPPGGAGAEGGGQRGETAAGEEAESAEAGGRETGGAAAEGAQTGGAGARGADAEGARRRGAAGGGTGAEVGHGWRVPPRAAVPRGWTRRGSRT